MKYQANIALREQLKQYCNITEKDIDTHESDLYIRHSYEVEEWLRKYYPFWNNITTFISDIDKDLWYDIPFANEHWFRAEARAFNK